MKRRDILIAGAALATGGGVAGVLAKKDKKSSGSRPSSSGSSLASPNINRGIKEFQMATSWPKNFPGLGIMPERFATALEEMSDGLLRVKVNAAGELVGALQCFDATSTGGVDMYHAAEYYWQGKSKAFSFFTAVPMGMTAEEIMGWIEFGGGQELWDELSARYNIKPLVCGNSGHQTGGWYKKKINSLEDFKGLRIRMPGMAGEVIRRLGGTAVQLAGGEIYQALQSGTIEATEWVGPWNDLAFGFYREAPHYYAPGFHEPGAALAVGVNLDVWDGLTSSEQAMMKYAAKAANDSSMGEYTHENSVALETLKEKHNIYPNFFTKDIMVQIGKLSEEVVAELGNSDKRTRKVYEAYKKHRDQYRAWTEMGDGQYISSRMAALLE